MVHGGGSRGNSGGGGSRGSSGGGSRVSSGGGSRSAPTSTSGGGSRNNTRQTATRNTTTTSASASARHGGGSRATNTVRTTTTTSISRGGRAAPSASRNTVTTESTTTRHGGGSTTRTTPHHTHRVNYPSSNINRRSNNRGGWNPFRRSTRREHPVEEHDIEEPLLIPERREVEEDSCCRGCACLACATTLGCLGFCCSPMIFALQAHRAKSILPVLVFTALLVWVQVMMTGTRQTWILNAGENRRITPSYWTRTVDVQVTTPHTTVEVDLYDLRGSSCPPLNGPMVTVHHDHDMTFGPGDYQYDYFYLNQGSRVEAGLYQIKGSAEVYMLQGQDKVDVLQESIHDDPNWLDNLLKAAKLHWTVKDYYRQIQAKFAANKGGDTYTLVYDNPYSNSGHLLVDLWLDLTTYNTKNYAPICDDLAFKHCAPVYNRYHSQCLLLDTSTAYGEGEEVTVLISEKRSYTLIGILSSIPAVLALVWEVYSCCKETRRTWGNDSNDDDDEEQQTTQPRVPSPIPSSSDRPAADPPVAPSAPTAPAAASIPVATAQVVEEDSSNRASAPVASVEPVAAPTDEKN